MVFYGPGGGLCRQVRQCRFDTKYFSSLSISNQHLDEYCTRIRQEESVESVTPRSSAAEALEGINSRRKAPVQLLFSNVLSIIAVRRVPLLRDIGAKNLSKTMGPTDVPRDKESETPPRRTSEE